MKRQANRYALSIEETLPKRINQCFKTRIHTCFFYTKDEFHQKSMKFILKQLAPHA